jgi:hypothetical protein
MMIDEILIRAHEFYRYIVFSEAFMYTERCIL